MAEPKGPPCGFLGLGSSPGAYGDADGEGGFDLVLRTNVDRHGVANAAGDVSISDAKGITAANKSQECDLEHQSSKLAKHPVRRGWSMTTWSQIKLDGPAPKPGGVWFVKKTKPKVVSQSSSLEEVTQYTKVELLGILSMYPEAPPSAYDIKSAYDSRLDIAAGKFRDGNDPARYTKGGPSMVINENFLYSFHQSKNLGGPHKTERADTLSNLNTLLVRIAQANLQKTRLDTLKNMIAQEPALLKLRFEETIRSEDGFNELTYLIKAHYDKVYEKIRRAKKHEENELYFHPEDHLNDVNETSVQKQLRTFTEVNVNSWAETDPQNPTIVRTNNGIRLLADGSPNLPFDERKELESPEAEQGDDQSDFGGVGEACISMMRQDDVLKKSNEDWEIYVESEIEILGEQYLAGAKIDIAFEDSVERIGFRLKDDPEEAVYDFLRKRGVHEIQKKELDSVRHTIEAHVEEQQGTPGSPYWRLLRLKQDLALRKLRTELISKINADQWYFVLQKFPPIELKPQTTHCAHPFCDYHAFDIMPPVGYRLVFMSAIHNSTPEHRLDEVSEVAGTPGLTEDGQMLFCLTCVENLFNGVDFIKEVGTSAFRNAEVQPPNIKPMLIAPGLDIFAATLHSFIRPEMRYTWHEFYTLNSFEYQAFMKWKNMCIRKTMWEIPRNRAFNLQITGQAAEYDLVDFFGDDVLDMNEPQPSIVTGVAVNMEDVNADDISTLVTWEAHREYALKQVAGVKRKAHPLSQVTGADDMDRSEHERSLGRSFAEKLDGSRTRVVKPLSKIMTLVDQRVQKAWAVMNPPYVPRQSRRAPDPPDRKWPPRSFWKSAFEGECEEAQDVDLQEMIDQKYEVINRRLNALGEEHHVNNRSRISPSPPSAHDTNSEDSSADANTDVASPRNERGRLGRCATCGTTETPDWRNGPAGEKTLCNACGIRYFRKRRRRQVPPPT